MYNAGSEHLSLFEEERGPGYCLCFGMSMLPILGLLLLALPHVTISDLPSVAVLLFLIFAPVYGCGELFKGRPAFQWHYHGVQTEVMEELSQEADSLSSTS